MTPEVLRSLIERGETLDVEFKDEEKTSLSDRDLVEAVVCLANRLSSEFAWLLIGVEDDGRITDARLRHESGRTDLARLTATVSGRTRPSLTVRPHLVPIEGREVPALDISPSRTPVGTSDGHYQRRTVGGDGPPRLRPLPRPRDAVAPG